MKAYPWPVVESWLRACIRASLRLNKWSRAARIATFVSPWGRMP
jgi:hypothetical protein